MKRRLLQILPALGLLALGCAKPTASTPPPTTASEPGDLEGREVVDNWNAKIGDVTLCPISGKKFEVTEKSGRFEYQGYTFVFCCAGKCLDKVEADPGKYLDSFVEQAGGPAGSPEAGPDPEVGGAIDDGPDDPQ
jgi:YHS domain-containing protein